MIDKFLMIAMLLMISMEISTKGMGEMPDIVQADITCKYTGGNKELLGYECPNWNATDVKVQTVNYYDNYNFLKNRMTPNMFQASYSKKEDYAIKYDCTQGLCTGSVRKILGLEQDCGVYSVCYYDALGRVAQKRTFNNEAQNEVTYYKYAITDDPIRMRHEYGSANPSVEVYEYTYDKAKRLLKETLALNGAKTMVICENEYDDLGRTTKAYYGMRRFSELFEYDLMGNVTKLQRGGNDDDGSPCGIDDLTLKYHGNQLLKVTDSNEGPYYKGAFHFVDGADEEVEYAYDANGNMTMDLNKGIESITYNDLNLPKCVTFKLKDDLTQTETEKKIEYFYDSDGEKRAVLYSNDDYIAYTENRVFENDKLKYLLFEGGYATFENGEKNPTFHFYIKDHLGNNRIVADAQGNVEQENHYYPSGTLIIGSKFTQDITSNQRYRFGGKELDRMYGLDWNDFGARMHNPLLNCWTTMDPLCEKYYDISPYVYCNNDPINIFDPTGIYILPDIFESTDEQGYAIPSPYTSYMIATTKFGQTYYGHSVLAHFLHSNERQYGVRGNGKHSNYGLEIQEYKMPTYYLYMGENEGRFGIKEKDNTLVFVLKIDCSNKSVSELLETITHELTLHGYNIENVIKAYEESGFQKAYKTF